MTLMRKQSEGVRSC